MSSEEEKTGTEQTGDAAQQVENATEDVDKEKEGMKEAYKAEKEKRQALEAENAVLQQQMAVAAANPVQAQPQAPSSTFEQAVTELGLRDAAYFTPEQQLAIEARREQLDNARIAMTMNQVSARNFVDTHPDYAEVVGTSPGPNQFVPSKELREIITKEPHLKASAYSSPNAAYKIVMAHREAAKREKEFTALKEHQGQLETDDKTKPMSPSSAGGGGGDRSGNLKNATYDDIRKIEQDIEAGVYD